MPFEESVMRRPQIPAFAALTGSLVLLCVAACAVKPEVPATEVPATVAATPASGVAEPTAPTASNWDGHVKQFEEAYFAAHPVFAVQERSEEHTSELQSLMRISYAVFCLK